MELVTRQAILCKRNKKANLRKSQIGFRWRRRELNPRPVMLGNEPLRVYSVD